MSSVRKGQAGEEQAAAYLRGLGVEIIKRNFKCSAGEVDIIGVAGDVLKFIEVKCWDIHSYSEMEHAVNRRKQNRIIQSSRHFLAAHRRYMDFRIQYDVVWISGEGREVSYIESAFTETGAA